MPWFDCHTWQTAHCNIIQNAICICNIRLALNPGAETWYSMLVFSQLLWFPMFSRLSPQFNIKLLVLFVGRANKCQSQVELEPLSFGCVQRDDRIKSYMACPDKELTFDFSCLVSNVGTGFCWKTVIGNMFRAPWIIWSTSDTAIFLSFPVISNGFVLLAFRILQTSFFLLRLISSHLLCNDRWPTFQSFFFFFSTLKQTDFKLFYVTLVSFYLFFLFR